LDVRARPTVSEMMEFGLQPMPEPQGFMAQLQDGQPLHEPPAALDGAGFDMSDLAAKNRNRGNYRCSKVRRRRHNASDNTIGCLTVSLLARMTVRRAQKGPRVSAGAVQLQVHPLRTAQEGLYLRRCVSEASSAVGTECLMGVMCWTQRRPRGASGSRSRWTRT